MIPACSPISTIWKLTGSWPDEEEHPMKRLLWIGVVLVIAIGAAAPFLDADFFRPAIERSLERGLGRRVEIKKARFNLFTGPGFTLEDVTIYEDPRAGIEPFMFVSGVEARVRLLSLFSRRLEFSNLRLHQLDADHDKPNINLVKTAAGPWNFQFLLNSAPALSGAMPAIKMRGGRVNFKFADTKSVFYFNDADFDVAPSLDGSLDLRFSGAPSRTDRAAQNFGHFFVRGTWVSGASGVGGTRANQRLDMKVELERSALDEAAHLIDRRGLGLHGVVAFEAQLSGPPSHLEMTGHLQIDDIHRWDLLPKRGGGWRIPFAGMLDLHGERLELASLFDTPNSPIDLEFRARDFLSAPRWDASAELKQMPVATLLEVARHMGSPLSEKLVADGSVSGAIHYGDQDGFGGRVELQDASLMLPEGRPLRAANAAVTIDGNALTLEPSTVTIDNNAGGDNQSAEVEGGFGAGGGLNLKITTRGFNVADLHSFGLSAIPLLEQTPQGTWRGWAQYRWTPGEAGEWSGEYDLQNARIAVDGLADPVRIQSAAVVSNGARISVTRLRARAGAVAFTGDYRYEPAATRPHKFHIDIAHADAAEIERLLAPALVRERGFFARTLRLGPAPAPDWLKERRADGTLSIGTLTIDDLATHVDFARLLWDGALLRLVRLHASADSGSDAPGADTPTFNGDLAIDLSGRAPHFRFDGKLEDVAYKGGRVDFEGSLDADGAGAELLTGAHAEGCLHGRFIEFAPETEFRAVKGCFEMTASSAGVRWKLPGIEVLQGADTFYGTGATQADGRLVLDLANRNRQVHYSSAIASLSQ
jgi:hypothetical protein